MASSIPAFCSPAVAGISSTESNALMRSAMPGALEHEPTYAIHGAVSPPGCWCSLVEDD